MTFLGALPDVASNLIASWFRAIVETSAATEVKTEAELPIQTAAAPVPPVFRLAPAPAASNSLLARRSQYYTDTLTTGQLSVDQVNVRVRTEVENPRNILLIASAGYFIKPGQFAFTLDGIAQASKTMAVTIGWKRAGTAIVPLTFAACEAGGTNSGNRFRTIGPDAGYPDQGVDGGGEWIDEDDDGVPDGIDCDDQNPHKFPLAPELGKPIKDGDGYVVRITESTEICPGTYNGYSLEIPSGSKDIHLSGEGAVLDGRVNGKPIYAQAIQVVNSDNIEISGFDIRFYEEPLSGPGMLRVQDSRAVSLFGLDITASKGNWPIRLAHSDDTTVEKVSTHTHSDRGLKAENCNRTTIKDSNFVSEKPYDYAAPNYALVFIDGGTNNLLIGGQLLGGQNNGLCVKDSPNFQGLQVTLTGNEQNGIFLDGAKTGYYRDNLVTGNGAYGLYIQRDTRQNTFYKNTFAPNTLGPYGARNIGPIDAPLNTNNFMENNPQP